VHACRILARRAYAEVEEMNGFEKFLITLIIGFAVFLLVYWTVR
jgi:hypothetical protein